MAGYSGTPLPQKLGIKSGHRVALIGAPVGFAEGLSLPADASTATKLTGPFDVLIVFVRSRAELEKRFPTAVAAMKEDAGLWIAWPKKSSGVATDMSEDFVRTVALPRGLVDNKVCAIDETWSGLRCVIRRENRAVVPKMRGATEKKRK
jgi:hypothetical protein